MKIPKTKLKSVVYYKKEGDMKQPEQQNLNRVYYNKIAWELGLQPINR